MPPTICNVPGINKIFVSINKINRYIKELQRTGWSVWRKLFLTKLQDLIYAYAFPIKKPENRFKINMTLANKTRPLEGLLCENTNSSLLFLVEWNTSNGKL